MQLILNLPDPPCRKFTQIVFPIKFSLSLIEGWTRGFEESVRATFYPYFRLIRFQMRRLQC